MSKIFPIRQIPTASGTVPGASPTLQQPKVDFREVLRLVQSSAVSADGAQSIDFGGRSERLMRDVIARYGFDRLPATYAELYGLFEYCDSLDAASGMGMRPKDQLREWQEASFVVWRKKKPELMPAIELYCAEDIEGLRSLHEREDTLTALGRRFLECEE